MFWNKSKKEVIQEKRKVNVEKAIVRIYTVWGESFTTEVMGWASGAHLGKASETWQDILHRRYHEVTDNNKAMVIPDTQIRCFVLESVVDHFEEV